MKEWLQANHQPPSPDDNDDDVTHQNDKRGEREEGRENNYKTIERN